MNKVTLYLKSYGADKESASTEVLNFLSSEIGDGYEIASVTSENDGKKLIEIEKEIITFLNTLNIFKEEKHAVCLVDDLKGLKTWVDTKLILKDNNIETIEEFDILEHNFDLDFFKVVELNYTTDSETLFIFEVTIELDD